MNIFVSIFSPVELYPPTINAIEYLAAGTNSIVIVTHSMEVGNNWKFPANVEVKYADSWPRNLEYSNTFNNIKRFVKYVLKFKKELRSKSFDLVLLYEPYAALAYRLTSVSVDKNAPILWYHNHDIFEISSQGKLSLGRLAIKEEYNLIKKVDVFSLPADERKPFFPLDKFCGKYFFIPNFPSIRFYNKFYKVKESVNEIRLLFQGRIANGHGLEKIIELLDAPIMGMSLSLHLKGIIEKEYQDKLVTMAKEKNVEDKLKFYGLTSYAEVPELGSTCHIGIGIHTKNDIMNKTLGTSSNKIYEYAALGLPVILYDNTHFRKHLAKYEWAFYTDCSASSLQECLINIISGYDNLSEKAHSDFLKGLNFESKFTPAFEYVETLSH